jgi:hypothetical protein
VLDRFKPSGRGRYETVQTLPFGKEVALPEPLKDWVR